MVTASYIRRLSQAVDLIEQRSQQNQPFKTVQVRRDWREPGDVAIDRHFAAHPEDGDVDELAAALGVTAADPRSQLADMAPRIRDDFGAGRVVTLDGWRLSETEVRMATLVWLMEGAPPPA